MSATTIGMLVSVHTMEAYWGSGCTTPLILNLDYKWRWVVRNKPRPLCAGKEPQYPLYRKLGGPQSWFGRNGEQRIFPPTGIGTGSFSGVKSGLGVTLTPHPLLVLWSWKSRAIPLLLLWAVRPVQSLSACTRVHFTFTLPGWNISFVEIFMWWVFS